MSEIFEKGRVYTLDQMVNKDDDDAIEIEAYDASCAAEDFAKLECDHESECCMAYVDGQDVEVKDEDGDAQIFTVYAEYSPTFSATEKE